MKNIVFTVILCALSLSVQATNYYVSTFGTSTNNGLTSTTPFPTIQKAADLTVAGDTVFIMSASTYNTTSGPILTIKRSGTANAYITYKAFAGSTPKIKASGNVWNAISINANYIVIDGLELEGNNANITYATALASYNEAAAGGTNWSTYANYNTNGLTIGGPAAESLFPHHVIVRNCKVHDFPGGGLNSIQADYTVFENNLVYNNAWYMMYAGSGISILSPFDSDTITSGYKNIVRNNICNTNKTTIPWVSSNPRVLSDGNGIIIDVNIRPYSGTGPAYKGRTLVENNISVNNGGSGIHAFKADHVDIINNTAYNNGTVVGYAEIFSNQCNDVNIINNIMYARTGADCNTSPRNASEVYAYNLYFNGNVKKMGANDVVADPKFVNLSTNLAVGNFYVQANSPALNTGSNILGQYSSKDILGVARPQGAKPDKGAYEFTTALSRVESLPLQDKTSLSPNPVFDKMTIEFAIPNTHSEVQIFDTVGNLVMKQFLDFKNNDLIVRQLATGLYVAAIYQNGQIVAVHKFIKQ